MKQTWMSVGILSFTLTFGIAQDKTGEANRESADSGEKSAYSVAERGAHHKVWERTVDEIGPDGKPVSQTHSYTELATGMHFKNERGEWEESKEEIEILPDNVGAIARKGQHKAIFPPEIKSGLIELQTPDGQWLRSRVWGLAYFDSATGESVLLAEVKESEGQLVGDNVVLYPNAFTDFVADIRYTYTKAGFEQDVVLRERPPGPETFNLNPGTTRLQVLTEFVEAENPNKTVRQAGSLPDETLEFGTMSIGAGKAFTLDGEGKAAGHVPVAKGWEQMEGRNFLIEAVRYEKIADQLRKLPEAGKYEGASLQRRGTGKTVIAGLQKIMPKRYAKTESAPRTKRMAKATPNSSPSFVMDYVVTLTDESDYTFQGDTTYYLSDSVYISGTSTVEGGAVLKYAPGTQLTLVYPPVWQASAYRPVIFTAEDDDTVGETIPGSTGNPDGQYATCALIFPWYSPTTISHFRISHAQTAVTLSASGNPVFSHGQLVSCGTGFNFESGSSYINLAVRNLLFANVYNGFYGIPSYSSVDVQNTTFSGTSTLAYRDEGYYQSASFKNCILANIGSLVNGPYFTLSGSTNGFYNCPQFGTGAVTNSFNPFQAAGAGAFYLANGCNFLNAGTTNLAPDLLAGLKQKTTFPPVVYSNVVWAGNLTLSPQAQRDTDAPDLGYHYEPLDYLTCNFTNGAQLTIASGTAIASGNVTGIVLSAGSSLLSVGTPQNPNWFVRYQSVQEQSLKWGGTNVSAGLPFSATGNPTAEFQFSKFASPAGGGGHLSHAGSAAFGSLRVQHCEFWDGNNTVGGGANTLTILMNNLFWRSPLAANNSSSAATLALSNNLVYGTTVSLSKHASAVWYAFNNAFDTCTAAGSVSNGYNAYLGCGGSRLSPTSAQDVVRTTTLGYASSWLGNYYLPANSPLLNVGSTTASLAGLYHFTTLTNQTKEAATQVDIGYHYVAVNSSGNPLDTDGDGKADYFEDINGDDSPTGDSTSWQSYNSPSGLTGGNGLRVFTPLK